MNYKQLTQLQRNLLDEALVWLYELKAEWRWKKDEPRAGNAAVYENLCKTIEKINNLQRKS